MNDEQFARWLDITLSNRGVTARDLARRIGVTDSAVSRWRSGHVKPGMDAVVKLANELNVDPLRLAVTAGLMGGEAVHVEPLPMPPATAQRKRVREQIQSIKGLTSESMDRLLAAYDEEMNQ